jgi:DNA-binding protein HU-beta
LYKSDLIEVLAARNGITVTAAEKFVNSFIKLVYEELHGGREVNISGFGKFRVSHRLPREGVNPRTGERIMIPQLNVGKFTAGEALKKFINQPIK